MKSRFFKYVIQNMLGMLGMSLYILADTFFISKVVGTKGITALNLVLPLYNLIFAIGAMIGVGSAIRFTVEKNTNREKADGYFFHALLWAGIISMIFIIAGIFYPHKIIELLGGNDEIIETGKNYTRIFMTFTPLFMWNHICNAFVRNDNNPSIAMAATLISSLFNIVFDYIFMFPLKMSMSGAALATALSPLVGILICLIHFKSAKNTIKFKPVSLSVKKLYYSISVGVSAFVAEISSGVITVAFNMIILGIAGNTGVAAYGVVANISLVAVALFNGVTQGSQPLVSEYYGKGQNKDVNRLFKMALITSFTVSVLVIGIIFLGTKQIVAIFNSENDIELAKYAWKGLRLYAVGFLFASLNIVGTGLLSAVEAVSLAFTASVMRGFVVIIGSVFIMAYLFGMTGVWLAYPAAEAITLAVTMFGIKITLKKMNKY